MDEVAYRCDKCQELGDAKAKFRVRLLPPGKDWKEETSLDLCDKCIKEYLPNAVLMLR